MKLSRRQFLHLAAGAAALPAVTRVARAQAYPSRPARIVCGYPPGGVVDIYARLIAQWLSERMGQQFIVETKPGAGGTIAAETVVRAAPDGYTLLLATSADTWNTTLYDNLKFNFARDVAAVAPMSRGPGVLVLHPSLPPQSVPELIAYAKSNPGKISVASAGIGSAPHMYWELFRSVTGVDMLHVPYRGGGPALTDLLGGQVQAYFGTSASTIEYVRTGRVRALAVTSATRAAALPEVPAMAEFLPTYEASIFVGIVAPHNTPAEIVGRLNQEINLALADPRIRQRIAELADTPLSLSAVDFARLIADETEKWGKVIRAAGIKPD
ncbi:MAG: MFS transporter [Blastocatellia bacterium]|nr:MAG: MFS transporter [Blastocatellia bacterium]